MQIKWYFWLQRWKNVMRYFIDELAFNLIPSSEAINSSLATILAILIHDCILKEGFNILEMSFCDKRMISYNRLGINQ